MTTTINNRLARLVDIRKPAHISVERLNFQNPGLSKRLNRILSNCGRSAVNAKLADLEEKFGITAEEVNPAYTSQTCSSCGHVERGNRSGDDFECRICGHIGHAGVNAAQNIRDRRSDPKIGSVWSSKATVLVELKKRFDERHNTVAWARPDDPTQNIALVTSNSLSFNT